MASAAPLRFQRQLITIPIDAAPREYKIRIMLGPPAVLSFDNKFRGLGWGTIPDAVPFEIQVVRNPVSQARTEDLTATHLVVAY